MHILHHLRNEFDLEEARILRNKTKKRYEQYLAELEATEVKRVVTLEGIARAKDLSVQVSVVCVVLYGVVSYFILNEVLYLVVCRN